MAKSLDLIVIAVGFGVYAALVLYKLVLMFRYRDDPDKLEALVSTDQVFPKRLKRFIYDEDYDRIRKALVPNSRPK